MIQFISMNKFILCFIVAGFFSLPAFAQNASSIDALLDRAAKEIRQTPEQSTKTLTELGYLKDAFSHDQEARFYLLRASSFGFQGKHKDRVELVESVIGKFPDADLRARFLYQLSTGYINLGEYERALNAMNESILLIPKLSGLNAKMDALQSAIALLNSLRAYDESLVYAERMRYLSPESAKSPAHCFGIADQVEINFLRGDRKTARALAPQAISICDQNERAFISLLIKSLLSVDLIDSGNYAEGIRTGIPLLAMFSESNKNSDYVTNLEEAIARAFLYQNRLVDAEHYGSQASNRAKQSNTVLLMEKTSETMAMIKRRQGYPDQALEYYEAALKLKDRLLDEQLQKNLAYQRVKFDIQDKSNQLALLEQKNQNLHVEQLLQRKTKQNLLLMIALAAGILMILGIWLWRVIRQRNVFQRKAQIDGLTQICNRTHFLNRAEAAVLKRTDHLSLVFFDMDCFKNINDSFGHPAGDWVLRKVSQTVSGLLRKDDFFGRLGGEEFAICLPFTDANVALQFAERCRIEITKIDSEPSGYRFPISASFGVATMNTAGISNFDKLLDSVDKALYKSKSEGRNCVSVFA